MELPVIEEKTYRPFHCGTQGGDWQSSNCYRCVKHTPEDEGTPKCEIEAAIFEAWCSDGSVSADIARRMNMPADGTFPYIWMCGEVEWTEAWKVESSRRRTYIYRIRKWWWETRRNLRKNLRERKRQWIMKRRWPIALREGRDTPGECWTEWATWALNQSGDEEMPERGTGGSRRCEEEGREGSCWCGKFNNNAAEEATK